jgi:hypothetical protein
VILREHILNGINGSEDFRITPLAETIAFEREPALEIIYRKLPASAFGNFIEKLK